MTDICKLLREYTEKGSEEAFREVVTRYVDLVYSTALRRLGGVTLSAAALGTFLTGHVVTATPAGIVASIGTAALAGAGVSSGLSLTTLKFMAMTKLKVGVASAIVVAGVATPLIIQQHSITA